MPLLRSGPERCVLRAGTNTIGGRGADALPVAALAFQPAVATIIVHAQGPAIIRRTTASVVVRVDDEPLGVMPAELRHGARIEFAGCHLTFDADLVAGSGAPLTNPIAVSTALAAGAEAPRARLLHLRTGRSYPLPARASTLGRDEGCDIQLDRPGVSRRHCAIAMVPGGYLLTDESSNGTVVNGERMPRTHILDDGDVITLHDEELRFELLPSVDAALPADGAAGDPATQLLDLSHLRTGDAASRDHAPVSRAAPRASLVIVRGAFTGASFLITRPVCAIGRGEQSDVRLRDDSVSSTHATLLRKGSSWFIVDQRSANGTFVDGYRIAGEREIMSGAAIRAGAVELLFRSFTDDGGESAERRPHRRGALAWIARWVSGGSTGGNVHSP